MSLLPLSLLISLSLEVHQPVCFFDMNVLRISHSGRVPSSLTSVAIRTPLCSKNGLVIAFMDPCSQYFSALFSKSLLQLDQYAFEGSSIQTVLRKKNHKVPRVQEAGCMTKGTNVSHLEITSK